MRIYLLQQFWFGETTYNDTEVHRDYGTIRFNNRPSIDGQAWLTTHSPGATFSGGAVTAVGGAAVKIWAVQYVDDNGYSRTEYNYSADAHIRLARATLVQWQFKVRLASAKAEGMIYWWDNAAVSSDFEAPNYSQQHWRIFERATGKILASETIWSPEGSEEFDHGPSANLIKQFGTDDDGQRVDVDAIEADQPPAGAERVDIARRALVEERAPLSREILPPHIFGD